MSAILSIQKNAFDRLLAGDYTVNVPAVSNDDLAEIALHTNVLARKFSIERQQIEALQKQVMLDPLTRAFNWRYLEKHIISTYERHWLNCNVSIIMFDLDYFKNINDSFGDECDDIVLVKVVEVAKRNVRKTDYVLRLGGEEFLIVLPFCAVQHCEALASLVLESIRELDFLFDDKTVIVTASLGVCSTTPAHASLAELIKFADDAFYEVKAKGRNQIVVGRMPSQKPSVPR